MSDLRHPSGGWSDGIDTGAFPQGDAICLHSVTDPRPGVSRQQEETRPMSYPSPGSGPNHPGWDSPQQPAGYGSYPGPGYGSPSQVPAKMGMGEAVSSVLAKYATFSGRARRSEYWWFYLAYVVADIVAAIADMMVGTSV